MIRRWLRAWLGIEDLAQAQMAHARDAAQRALVDRLDLTRDVNALATKIALIDPHMPTTTSLTPDTTTDPHLGRW